MNTSLSKFLEAPNITDLKGTYLLKRLDVPFTFSAMTDQQLTDYQQRCMTKDIMNVKSKKPTKKSDMLDFGKFKKLVIANHVVDPNISDPDFLKKGGWAVASEFIEAKLTPGEVIELYQAINELSGFDNLFDDDIEEAKN